MGRGSYLGGSTIIGPYTRWSDADSVPIKTKPKKEPQSPLNEIRLNFLHLVIDSELNGSILTSIPAKSRASLSKEVDNKGGIEKWARAQPLYQELKATKLKKRKRRESKRQPANTSNHDLSRPIAALQKRIDANKELIKKATKQIEEDEGLIQHIIHESKKAEYPEQTTVS
jgi:hypothetical protein